MIDRILAAFGATTGITGALLIALNMDLFLLGYIIFLSSSVAWVIYAIRTAQKSLLTMNLVFGCINIIGVYNFI